MTYFFIFTILHIICGVFAYGLTLAYFQKNFENIAEEKFQDDSKFALVFGICGIIGLAAVIMNILANYKFAKGFKGLMYKNPYK